MKTLQVYNGDLQLDTGGRLQFQTGSNKLVQDLSIWLETPFGTPFTAPAFGSTLTGLIGQNISSGMISNIQSEVSRVLGLYQAQQLASLRSAQNLSQLSNWNRSEIISSINTISVSQNPVQYSTINVTVNLTTLANTTVSINLLINSNGVQVTNG